MILLGQSVTTTVLILVLQCLAGAEGQNVLKCMSCRKAPHYSHCEEMVLCHAETEVCYIEEEIDVGGEKVVNAGCRGKAQCDAIGCFGDENKRRKRQAASRTGASGTKNNLGDLDRDVICHHCCDGDFCNLYGCPGSYDVTHLTGSRCFVCEHVLQPEHCNVIKNCEPGYSCGQELLSFGSGNRYTLQCMRTSMCEILKAVHSSMTRTKRSYTQIWADCCEGHLCNGYKPMKKGSPPMQSATYRCPPRGSGLVVLYPPGATTTETPTPQTTSGPCEDVDQDCNVYGVEYICKGVYAIWGHQHCKKYCGLCERESVTLAMKELETNAGAHINALNCLLAVTFAFTCLIIKY